MLWVRVVGAFVGEFVGASYRCMLWVRCGCILWVRVAGAVGASCGCVLRVRVAGAC
jgi:hypothetical protein